MKENLHEGHRERLRARVQASGMDSMEDYQILEYILSFVIPRQDTNPIAHRLINTFGSLKNVLEANPKDLVKVNGIGEITAMFLNTYVGVFYRYEYEKSKNTETINTPHDASVYFKHLLKHTNTEQVYVAMLDHKNKIIQTTKLADGSYDNVNVTPRHILDMVVRSNCSNIILCHNHPDGKPTPSSEDIKFTRDLILSLTLNQVQLLDHIIIGKDGYYSFKTSHKIASYLAEAQAMLKDRSTKYATFIVDDTDTYIPFRRNANDKK